MNKPALVVMARAPVAGSVKTRLQPSLTPARCVELYKAFLEDTIDLAVSLKEYSPFLAYTPSDSAPVFRNMVSKDMELIPQIGDDLGRVMDMLIRTLTARKHSPVVIIGSDIPTLQPDTLRRALVAVNHADVCLGPSSDGGYYLIGANRPIPAVFQDIPWSTSSVLKVTQEKASKAGLSTAFLEQLDDVDTIEDISLLEAEIRGLPGIPGARIPLRTKAWLDAMRLNIKGEG